MAFASLSAKFQIITDKFAVGVSGDYWAAASVIFRVSGDYYFCNDSLFDLVFGVCTGLRSSNPFD